MIPKIERLKQTDSDKFFLMAGPCVIEGEQMALDIAEQIIQITSRLKIPYIFKGSYRKANRSRIDSFAGIGDEKALKILRKVNQTFGIPVVTDIHSAPEAETAAGYVDVLQIPAFLCRQTDILLAAAQTGKPVNIKKGQFLTAGAMKHAVDKLRVATATSFLPSVEPLSDTTTWLWISVESRSCKNWAYRWCSTLPIRCSSQTRQVALQAVVPTALKLLPGQE